MLGNIHPLNGPLSGTTQVSRYQKGKRNLDFTGARDSEWQRHQPGNMQVCTSLQTDNHASTQHSVFYRLDALPATQLTASKHRRQTMLGKYTHTHTHPFNFSSTTVWCCKVSICLSEPELIDVGCEQSLTRSASESSETHPSP